jgi:hypothetical protein
VLAYLTDRPTAYLDDVVLAVYDQFDVELSRWSILRLLQRHRWSRKVAKRRALEANGILRSMFMTKVSRYSMDRLVFLDESASNERTGYRKRGWAPVGVDCTELVDDEVVHTVEHLAGSDNRRLPARPSNIPGRRQPSNV